MNTCILRNKSRFHSFGCQNHYYSSFQIWEQMTSMLFPEIEKKACSQYVEKLDFLRNELKTIPNIYKISEKIEKYTGWRLVPVTGLLPGQKYFEFLSKKHLPVVAKLRNPENLLFSEIPDIWHDIVGHVPLLFDPVNSKFMSELSQTLRYSSIEATSKLEAIYWFSIECGLVKEKNQLKAYGASLVSSYTELSNVFQLNENQIYPFVVEKANLFNVMSQEFPIPL